MARINGSWSKSATLWKYTGMDEKTSFALQLWHAAPAHACPVTVLAEEAFLAWLQAAAVADFRKLEALLIVVVRKRVCLRTLTSMRPEL